MSKTTFLLVAFFVSYPLFAARTDETPDDKAAIRKVLDDQANTWNKEDLPGFMDGYWNDKKLTFYSGNTKTAGWQATLDRYRKKYQGENKEMGKLAFVDLSIELLGADHALVKGRYRLTLKDESPTGLFTAIFKKVPAGWRIIHDHTSN